VENAGPVQGLDRSIHISPVRLSSSEVEGQAPGIQTHLKTSELAKGGRLNLLTHHHVKQFHVFSITHPFFLESPA